MTYEDGYRAGRADKLLGYRCMLAATSQHQCYRLGYLAGQRDTRTWT